MLKEILFFAAIIAVVVVVKLIKKRSKENFEKKSVNVVDVKLDEADKTATAEKIGTNNCIISVNNKKSIFSCVDLGGKARTVYHYTAYIKIDGENKGVVTKPFSIIHLNPGIHTLSIEFDPNVDGITFTLTENQFRVSNSNKFFSYKNLKYDTILHKDSGFVYDNASFDNLEQFLSHAEIDKHDFESYIRNL